MSGTKKRGPNALLLIVASFVAGFVGLVMAMVSQDSTVFFIGVLLVLAGIVLFVFAMIEHGKNVRAVASVVMGAAVKLNNQPSVSRSVSDEIGRLTELHRTGTLNDAEFAAAKAKTLG